MKIALASNPLEPAVWSDRVGDDIDIDFEWLNHPDSTDVVSRGRERLIAMVERYASVAQSRGIDKIVRDAFEKHGVVGDAIVSDEAIKHKIFDEIAVRSAHYFLSVPYVRSLSAEEIQRMFSKTAR